jgi:hypothetical protein
MYILSKRFLSLTFLSFAGSQTVTTGTPTLELQAIQAHFKQAELVPELLSSFEPSALLSVNFAGVGDITPGQLLNKAQSAPTPTVTVTPANASVQLTGTYTVFMVDADVVNADLSKGVNRHWLVNGVKITDGKLSNASATAITAYAGPGPAAGSGAHRYTIILYEQPSTFTAPEGFQQPIGVTPMDLNAYITNSKLGPLVAATYFRVEEGTASVAAAATSAVVTSTLPAAASTTSKVSTTTKPSTAATPTSNGAVTLHGFSSVFVACAGVAAFIML